MDLSALFLIRLTFLPSLDILILIKDPQEPVSCIPLYHNKRYFKTNKKTRRVTVNAKKFLSIFCIVLILSLFGCTLFLAITNSPYFMGCLFLSFIVPVFLYAFVWLYKLTHPAKDNAKEEKESSSLNDS